MASGVSSIKNPFLSSVMPSAAQLPPISTLASPQAAASRTTIPFVSYVDGKRNRSALVFHARSCSLSYTAPVKIYCSGFRRLAAFSFIRSASDKYHTEINAILRQFCKRIENERKPFILDDPAYK